MPQSKPHVQESPVIKGAPASELHERPASDGFRNTSKLKKVGFQKLSTATCEMPSREGHKGVQGSLITKIIDLA